ncbi:hypothetical protein BDA96_04G074400 [Sorghum bicolor]|uniref:Uncharacterized protein n=2 Tax=Sorghum bicolor TaxID=4558 RepID=A0A921R4M6_SORBI|nr:hypothetical protein BDA96_04G074400 [Sorghum bicolor]OQU84509.1 hypothetical protein SORBI_3004G068750 [Sorghum bicolor]
MAKFLSPGQQRTLPSPPIRSSRATPHAQLGFCSPLSAARVAGGSPSPVSYSSAPSPHVFLIATGFSPRYATRNFQNPPPFFLPCTSSLSLPVPPSQIHAAVVAMAIEHAAAAVGEPPPAATTQPPTEGVTAPAAAASRGPCPRLTRQSGLRINLQTARRRAARPVSASDASSLMGFCGSPFNAAGACSVCHGGRKPVYRCCLE